MTRKFLFFSNRDYEVRESVFLLLSEPEKSFVNKHFFPKTTPPEGLSHKMETETRTCC